MLHAFARWVALVPALLTGCVYVPKSSMVYDQDCRIETRQMRLEAEQISSLGRCSGGDGCLAILVGAGVVGAASVIVSGSIVVVGNLISWVEKKGRCALK